MYGGNQETVRGTLFDINTPLWLVVRTYNRRRRELPKLLDRPEYQHARIIRLEAPAEASGFLNKVCESGPNPHSCVAGKQEGKLT